MDRSQFFLQRGIRSLEQLNELLFAAAFFWKVNPLEMGRESVSTVLEFTEQAHKINGGQSKGK